MIDILSIILATLAGVIQLWGYFVYVRVTKDTTISSWMIWAVGSTFDVASYLIMTDDWIINILPFACALACIAVFLYMLVKRRFGKADKKDWAFFAADNVVTLIWLISHSATTANLLYQVSTFASYVPMTMDVLSGKTEEKWKPWIIWTVAYVLHLVAVIMRFDQWEDLAYPVVHVVTQFMVLYAMYRHQTRTRRSS